MEYDELAERERVRVVVVVAEREPVVGVPVCGGVKVTELVSVRVSEWERLLEMVSVKDGVGVGVTVRVVEKEREFIDADREAVMEAAERVEVRVAESEG